MGNNSVYVLILLWPLQQNHRFHPEVTEIITEVIIQVWSLVRLEN